MPDVLLELSGICKYYTGTQSVVMGLNNVDLRFRAGEFVAITGESGSGKSTLAQVICGILPYESGELRICGKPTSHYDSSDWERYRRERISYISQNYGILAGSTVLGNVVSALRIAGMEKSQAAQRAEELLKLVELWDLRRRRAAKLSSGQKQRLGIARALAKPAPILVADEPTGNLDRENSEKVIRLLAKAARERLVILITHDFQEAEGYATRRINLQDGKVTMDAPLEVSPVEAATPQVSRTQEKRGLWAYVAGLQMGGRPVWSVLVGLFFALTAFAVFSLLGTFIVRLDDTSTRIYDDSAFPNGDKTRIVIQRLDAAPFEQEDYDALLALSHVEALERSGYLADWQYAWQQDVDYRLHYHVETVGDKHDNDKLRTVSVELLPKECAFLRTVPLLPEGKTFLTAGRLPENMYEVVLSGEESRLGETITVYYRDEKTMSVAAYVKLDVTVVGVTDYGSGLYFSEELGHVISHFVENGGTEKGVLLTAPAYDGLYKSEVNGAVPGAIPQNEWQIVMGLAGDTLYGFETLPVYLQKDPSVPLEQCPRHDLEVVGHSSFTSGIAVYTPSQEPLPRFVLDREAIEGLTEEQLDAIQETLNNVQYRVRGDVKGENWAVDHYLYSDEVCAVSVTLYRRGFLNAQIDAVERGVVGTHDSTCIGYALVTKNAFDELVGSDNPKQVSLYLTDYAYTDQTIEALQEMGYMAISPFRQGATAKNPTLAAERMKTLQVCLLALAAVVVLQLLVLRELFGVQNESYKLLADMGLGRKTAGKSLMGQVLCFALLGQAAAFGAVWVCGAYGVRRIQAIVNYLPAENWLILSGVHLVLSLLAGWLILRNLNKRVYPRQNRAADLDLDALEEEAAV